MNIYHCVHYNAEQDNHCDGSNAKNNDSKYLLFTTNNNMTILREHGPLYKTVGPAKPIPPSLLASGACTEHRTMTRLPYQRPPSALHDACLARERSQQAARWCRRRRSPTMSIVASQVADHFVLTRYDKICISIRCITRPRPPPLLLLARPSYRLHRPHPGAVSCCSPLLCRRGRPECTFNGQPRRVAR